MICEDCYGTGSVTFNRDGLLYETADQCPDCNGTGEIEGADLPYDDYPEIMHDARSGR
jgi:DnaJ-class molecular chaperone